jgi:AraC-like DNA-binding protein
MIKDKVDIITALVGEFSDSQIENLEENLEYYINPHVSLFIPIYKHCDFATSPNHSHPSYSFIYSIKSTGYFMLENKKVAPTIDAHSFICAFSPDVYHQEIIEKGFSNYIAIFIEKDYFENELAVYTTDKLCCKGSFFPANESLLFLLKLLMLEHSKNDIGSKKVIESFNYLISNLLIKILLGKETASLSMSSQSLIDNSIIFMYDNIERKITVDEIASQVAVSTSYFTKIFKETTNKTPIEYLTDIRIERAKRLLKGTDKNLTDIAFDCGFSSSSYFSHCFIDSVKLTPSEYRKRFLPSK